jgi:hypothetical protein
MTSEDRSKRRAAAADDTAEATNICAEHRLKPVLRMANRGLGLPQLVEFSEAEEQQADQT